jgi:streptogramin lyase
MRSRSRQHRGTRRAVSALVAAVACALGAATALLASAGTAGAGTTLQVQAFAVPSSAFTAPLATAELPMTTDPGGQGEWVLVSGASGGTLLDEPNGGGTPNVVQSGLDDNSGKAPFLSFVTTGGSLADAWSVADGYKVLGLTSAGAPIQITGAVKILYDSFKPDARDMTADTSGDLFIPDHDGANITRANFSHLNGSQWQLPNSFTTPKPDAVAFAGGLLWFSTDSGQLGSVSPSSTANDTNGPDAGVSVNGNGHTLTAGPDGNLWAVGGGQSGAGGSSIVKINPSSGAVLATYTAGLPAGSQISAITTGPDGNIWFTESGTDQIGQLSIASGTITNYPLPSGFQLPPAGSDVIASGSPSSGTLFFGAETSANTPAIGVISGAVATQTTQTTQTTSTTASSTTATSTNPVTSTATTPTKTPPAAGHLTIARRAEVSKSGVASLKLTCRGGACAGRVSLLLTRTQLVKVHHKLVRKRRTQTLGSAPYNLGAGHSATVKIRLTRAGRSAVAAAPGKGLAVVVKLQPAHQKPLSSKVSLLGPRRQR